MTRLASKSNRDAQEWAIMAGLYSYDNWTAARHLGMPVDIASRTLQRLRRKGFVSSSTARLWKITPKGRAFVFENVRLKVAKL